MAGMLSGVAFWLGGLLVWCLLDLVAFWFGGLLIEVGLLVEGGLLVESGLLLWPSGVIFCYGLLVWPFGKAFWYWVSPKRPIQPEGHNRRPYQNGLLVWPSGVIFCYGLLVWPSIPPPGSRLRHTVNERPVRILLECILVTN